MVEDKLEAIWFDIIVDMDIDWIKHIATNRAMPPKYCDAAPQHLIAAVKHRIWKWANMAMWWMVNNDDEDDGGGDDDGDDDDDDGQSSIKK